MKSLKTRTLVTFLMLVALLSVHTQKLWAVSENTERWGNVGVTAAMTLVKGFIQGNIHSAKDVAKCLGYGAIAGYGFYQAKFLAAKGSVLPGILVANLAASVCENVSRGKNPFAYLGFSLPLIRLEVATPLAKNPIATVHFSLSLQDIWSLAKSVGKASRVSFRDGLLTFGFCGSGHDSSIEGWTYGLFPAVREGQREEVYRHEVIHVIQNLQLMAVSPEPFLSFRQRLDGKKPFLKFTGFRLLALGFLNDIALKESQANIKGWKEIEAYHFAD